VAECDEGAAVVVSSPVDVADTFVEEAWDVGGALDLSTKEELHPARSTAAAAMTPALQPGCTSLLSV
jgi:hypothetical protein